MNQPAITFFKTHDPVLYLLYTQLDLSERPIKVEAQPTELYFFNLCESIVSQQLSIRAADTIWDRFKTLVDQKIDPATILLLSDDAMRSVGLSRAKVVYIKALADAVRNNEVPLQNLSHMSDEEVIRSLTWVKGIGRWTAEMFIMFTLGREDTFSLGDLGLRNAVQRWYGTPDDELSLDEMSQLSARWSPYRTFAARILWRSLELPKT